MGVLLGIIGAMELREIVVEQLDLYHRLGVRPGDEGVEFLVRTGVMVLLLATLLTSTRLAMRRPR